MNDVYSLKHKRFGLYLCQSIQSGYRMFEIVFEDSSSDYHYPADVLFLSGKYDNLDLWRMAETNRLPHGVIIEDQEGNQLIYTGKAFQIYYTQKENKYVGFCKGDMWKIVDVDESELSHTIG